MSILLVGAGPMAVEYAKVFKAIGIAPIVVGRSEASAQKFTAETGIAVSRGGLDAWLADSNHFLPERAVVAVGEKWVGASAKALLTHGVRQLLVEKPGGFDADDILSVNNAAAKQRATVYVGYNRRFYASVEAAKRIIAEDGGVTSFNFEFTEWSHVIGPIEKEEGVKEQWFLSNSTHVIDLAFYLGGMPQEMSAYAQGGLAWHPTSSIFAGAGRSVHGALFSYQANWEAPGRWGVEVLTRKHRLIFRPIEKLQIQKIGSVAIEMVEVDDSLDKDFKPGLYKQVHAFLAEESNVLPTISEQVSMLDWYLQIRGDVK
nr:Gfo/Idh/MocA family oxidoreductase [Solidesulfovibrio fructosivorans]